jgi:N-acetylmuramic acid 6-phosphate etherase
VHPAARDLDRLSPRALLELIAGEEKRVARAVFRKAGAIARASRVMAEALADGNRVFFMGAGTSGRLGVLEAAECPPTFGTRPAQIQALMAGGSGAVVRAREGAEDRGAEAVAALRRRKLGAGDLLVGISASSITPFVRRGLAYARRRRARTVLLTCAPGGRGLAELVISTPVGPEILAGSTRLKAATATKLVLNSLTLLAMVRLGKAIHGGFAGRLGQAPGPGPAHGRRPGEGKPCYCFPASSGERRGGKNRDRFRTAEDLGSASEARIGPLFREAPRSTGGPQPRKAAG